MRQSIFKFDKVTSFHFVISTMLTRSAGLTLKSSVGVTEVLLANLCIQANWKSTVTIVLSQKKTATATLFCLQPNRRQVGWKMRDKATSEPPPPPPAPPW